MGFGPRNPQEEVWQQIYVLGGAGLTMALILDSSRVRV